MNPLNLQQLSMLSFMRMAMGVPPPTGGPGRALAGRAAAGQHVRHGLRPHRRHKPGQKIVDGVLQTWIEMDRTLERSQP